MFKKILTIQIILTAGIVVLFLTYLYVRSIPVGRDGSIQPIIATTTLAIANNEKTDPSRYPFINPAVITNLGKEFIINFKPLREALAKAQSDEKSKTFVYFLYLNNSSWIGLNERDMFIAASTIKVPLAMSVYKLIEQGKLNAGDTYKLSESDLDENFGDLYKSGVGSTFTIEQLVETMLRYSDNTAARALLHVTELIGVKDPFIEVYEAMGWQKAEFGLKPTYIEINEKTLANMFVSLYNATYLSHEDSQKILNYLDSSPFDQQIAGGVPKPIPVAHKIGIDDGSKVYSDCGIVYVPHRPYLLCLGVQGEPQIKADAFMSKVSRIVYEYVTNN